jgi:hypothetical protein
MMFGPGEITDRLRFYGWYVRVEFKPQDLWVGAYWKRVGHVLDVWLCLLPCLPLHFCLVWRDPEQ